MAKSLARSTFIVLGVVFICAGGRMIAGAQDKPAAQVTHSGSTQEANGAAPQTPAPQPGAPVAANRQINFAPLSADEKLKRAFKSAFFNPLPYAFTAIDATITEARERHQPQKTTGDRF